MRVLNSRGPPDRRAVLLLAAILGLSTADGGTLGALAPQLERAFHIGTTQIGLLDWRAVPSGSRRELERP